MSIKVLYVATVVKKHIMQFHIPFLKMCKDAGWETAVAARNDYADAADCVIPFCDTYFDIPFERSPFKLKNIAAYYALKKVIQEGEYDIIHCHTPVGAMLTRLAARSVRKKGTKVIYTAHGFHFYKGAPLLNWLLYYPVERILARWTDVLITINHEDHQCAQRFKAGKVVYIPGVGIDTERFSAPISEAEKRRIRAEIGVPEDAVLLLSVGELNKNKNHALVVKAMAYLENKNIHYCIAGEGECREALTALSKKLGISARVHLLGYCTNVDRLYKASDFFCFPSLREGLPVALMEAIASGLPCAASRIRGNVDLLGEGCKLIFNSDDVNELCAVLHLAGDADIVREEIERNQKSLRNFSLEKVLVAIKDIYLRC